MLCCSCSHVTIIVTIIIIPMLMFFLIHVITRKGVKGLRRNAVSFLKGLK
jgi:hypothetical protein